MGKVVSYAAHRRQQSEDRVRGVDPLLFEIVEALYALNGAAHRETVVAQIAAMRMDPTLATAPSFRDEVFAAFSTYRAQVAGRRTPPLLHLPLGETSYRWALTSTGIDLMTPPARGKVG